MVKIPR